MLSRVMKQLHRSKKPSERLTWRKVVLPFHVPTKQAYLIDSLGLVRDIHITASLIVDRQDSSLYIRDLKVWQMDLKAWKEAALVQDFFILLISLLQLD